jgi:hypothetical protein
MNAEELGVAIVDAHTKYYSSFLMAGVSTDISACRLNKSDDLANAVGELAEELRAALPKSATRSGKKRSRSDRVYVEDLKLSERAIPDAMVMAHWRAQSYRFERHTDLYDFCDLLSEGCEDERIIKACEKVKEVIKGRNGARDGYVIKSCHTGTAYQYSNGVAVYFPWAEFDSGYRRLRFSKDSSWGRFLDEYVVTTRRRPRGLSGASHVVEIEEDREAEVRDNPEIGRRDNPEIRRRDNPEIGTRDNPEIRRRDNPEIGTRDNPEIRRRDNPEIGTRDNPEIRRRDNPEIGTRDNPEINRRDNPAIRRRDNPEIGTRGELILPEVKNPPDMFFDDICCG